MHLINQITANSRALKAVLAKKNRKRKVLF